jgi:zinc transport system substrate-binding protein
MSCRLSKATLFGTVAALGHPAWADDDATAWRLFVADHTDPVITVIDLDAPDKRSTFEVAGPARL